MSKWDALTAQALRRTGMVLVTADDVTFVHQTLHEFLAARHAARDPHARRGELLRLSHKKGLLSQSYLTSYDRFLVAAWIVEGRSPPGLKDLIAQLSASYGPAAGIAELVRDGVDLGSRVRESAAVTLRKMASGRDLSRMIVAAEDLASVDVPSAVEVLSVVLRSPTISFPDRARLSKKIIEFDPLHAVDVFAELSMSRRLDIIYRDHASDLTEMVREREGDVHELIVLTGKLARLDRLAAVTMLAEALDRHTWKKPHRQKLLTWLATIQSSL
ncbi:hypothetical protein [Nonomuraea longicatena]|uniref:hypothetical protein n=1 Tax=Nonomuraea longicatena TaxID=83682 RepID=UPI0031D956C6